MENNHLGEAADKNPTTGPGHEGTGLSVIAAQDAIDMQALGDILQIQAKE